MFGMKRIIGNVLGILASIGAVFGFLKGRKRRQKSMDEIERDINEINQEIITLSDEELTIVIKEMTDYIAQLDKWIGLEEFGINEDDIEINRLNDTMFYYGYVHGGPYGAVDYMSREEKYRAWQRLMDILMNNARIAKIGP